MFLYARLLPLVRISVILDHIWKSGGEGGGGEVKTQRPPKKGHFMDAELTRKTFKKSDLTTTNTILMKPTTIMYLHESVNWKPLRARNSFLLA